MCLLLIYHESVSVRILKIDQHLGKLWQEFSVFFDSRCRSPVCTHSWYPLRNHNTHRRHAGSMGQNAPGGWVPSLRRQCTLVVSRNAPICSNWNWPLYADRIQRRVSRRLICSCDQHLIFANAKIKCWSQNWPCCRPTLLHCRRRWQSSSVAHPHRQRRCRQQQREALTTGRSQAPATN